MNRPAALFAALFVAAGLAHAEPAVVYDMGGKFDKSFNEAGFRGVERYKKDTGGKVLEFEIANETQREQALRRMAERGASPIIGIGFSQAAAVQKIAKEFPKLKFTVIDGVAEGPNVQSVLFKEQEGSFLVGVLGALASKSGKVGFIGGMDIPLIRRFQCGYEQGVKWANPKAEVLVNTVGTTGAAWNDPARGAELAKAQFSKGVDVVFAAAGATGTGIYQAAKDAGKYAIGVDSNQNFMQPGTILTSMLKRVDTAVYQALKDHKPGLVVLGLKDGGVDYTVDEYNAKLITPAMKQKAEAARAEIVGGRIKVAEKIEGGSCK